MKIDLKLHKIKILQKVIGQDKAVDKLLLLLYKHYLKLQYDLDISNSSILLIGETGIGKTYAVKTVCEDAGLPFIEINGKSINQEGWEGMSFIKHLENNVHLINKEEPYAAIFIDEFDKLCMPNVSSNNKDNSIQIQAGLLKYIEGMMIDKKWNTKYFCFIFAGAFTGIDIHNKQQVKSIGFNSVSNSSINLEEQLKDYGIIPELLGRIKDIVIMNPLSKEMLENYYESQYNMLNIWRSIPEGQDLLITQYDIDKAIDIALNKNLGIRGFDQEIEKHLDEYLTKNYLKNN